MLDWRHFVGAAVGVVLGATGLELARSAKTASGAVVSECDGHLQELVVHYEPSARDLVATAYRQFLAALDSDVRVLVVCPDRATFDDFRRVACPKGNVAPILVGHAITTWSRDRWTALAPMRSAGVTTILSPRGEAGDAVWPARAGDQRVGDDIARALAPSTVARRSRLYFDAGDLLADGERVFVVARVLGRNLQQTVTSREELIGTLTRELGRPVVLLDKSPDHHAAMFMAAAGERRILVGDPSLASRLIKTTDAAFANLADGADFSPETQELFDAVARQCAAAGYGVTRVPVVPARDGRTYVTYTNVLLDERPGRRVAYLPTYRGFETLNAAAAEVWTRLGYEVRPIDCSDVYRHFGCLHCLVNVLRRGTD